MKPDQLPVLDELTVDKVNHALRLVAQGRGSQVARKPHSSVGAIPGLASVGGSIGTLVPTPTPSTTTFTVMVRLSAAMATLAPVRILDGVAYPITSLDVAEPTVDGLLLEAGGTGDSVKCAVVQGVTYEDIPVTVPGPGILFLSQTGTLTTTVPSAGAGDLWQAVVGRYSSDSSIVFDPQTVYGLA